MTGRFQFSLKSLGSNLLRERILAHFAQVDSEAVLLDSNDFPSDFQWIAAWEARRSFTAESQSIGGFYRFWEEERDWCFGHLNFGLGAQTDGIAQNQARHFEWPLLAFFIPQTVVYARGSRLLCESYCFRNEEELLAALPAAAPLPSLQLPAFAPSLSGEAYLEKLASLRRELHYGNIYEINFCQEWLAQGALAPEPSYRALNQRHRAPFSAYYRLGPRYLLCFSPERYLQKRGDRVISQPIKGTAARGRSAIEDQQNREALRLSEKEQAENVMIVDLVRNDLSKTAAPGSVKVDELFGIYSFPAVHQMISTISSRLASAYHWGDLLATTFPMGSMTGAPKHRALQLIESHENFHRELYSGSVGYIDPAGNMDFNVVIRSIMHHREKALSSVRVGSAITIHCDPQMEYEECLLKAEKLLR